MKKLTNMGRKRKKIMSKNGLTKLLSAILATGLVLQPISGNIGLWTVMAEEQTDPTPDPSPSPTPTPETTPTPTPETTPTPDPETTPTPEPINTDFVIEKDGVEVSTSDDGKSVIVTITYTGEYDASKAVTLTYTVGEEEKTTEEPEVNDGKIVFEIPAETGNNGAVAANTYTVKTLSVFDLDAEEASVFEIAGSAKIEEEELDNPSFTVEMGETVVTDDPINYMYGNDITVGVEGGSYDPVTFSATLTYGEGEKAKTITATEGKFTADEIEELLTGEEGTATLSVSDVQGTYNEKTSNLNELGFSYNVNFDFVAPKVVEGGITLPDPDYSDDENDYYATITGEKSVVITVTFNEEVSAVETSYSENATVEINADNKKQATITLGAGTYKAEDFAITSISDASGMTNTTPEKLLNKDVVVDGTAPTIKFKTSKGKKGSVTYTFTLSDEQSGVDVNSIRYTISKNEPQFESDFDKTPSQNDIQYTDDQLTLTISVSGKNAGVVYVSVKNKVGLRAQSDAETLVVEDEEPVITITAAEGDSFITATKTHSYKIQVTENPAEDFSGIDTIEYYISDDVGGTNPLTESIEKKYTHPRNLNELNNTPNYKETVIDDQIPDDFKETGKYYLVVTATDFAGNETKNIQEFVIDNTAPEATVTYAKKADIYNADSAGFTVTFTDKGDDNNDGISGLKKMTVTAKNTEDADAEPVVKTKEVNSEEIKHEDTIEFTSADLVGLGDGLIQISVEAEDFAGNTLANDNLGSYDQDLTSPTIESIIIDKEAKNEKYFNDEEVTTTVEFSEEMNADTVVVEYTLVKEDGSSTNTSTSMTKDKEDAKKYSFVLSDEATYTSGTIKVYGKDVSGNAIIAKEEIDSVPQAQFEGLTEILVKDGVAIFQNERVIDRTKPVIEIAFNNNEAKHEKYYNTARTATVSITEKNFKADEVVFTQEATNPSGEGTSPSPSAFTDSEDVHTATIAYTSSYQATHNLTVDYTDLAGNEAKQVKADEFVIDMTNPKVEITYGEPSRKELGSDPQILFYSEAVKDNAAITVKMEDLYLNDKGGNDVWVKTKSSDDPDAAAVAKDGVSEKDYKLTEDGLYQLIVGGTDLAGNPLDITEYNYNLNEETGEKESDYSTKGTSEYTSKYEIVLDKKAPVATISYNKPINTDYVDKGELYYGLSSTTADSNVTITFTDENAVYPLADADLSYTHSYTDVSGTTTDSVLNPASGSVVDVISDLGEGIHSYVVSPDSMDRAGNKVVIKEVVDGTATAEGLKINKVIYDVTNPVIKMTIPESANMDGADAYYGKDDGGITGKYTLVETNFDADKIKVDANLSDEKSQYRNASFNWKEPTQKFADDKVLDVKVDTDGAYKFEAMGVDKANNPIIIDSSNGAISFDKVADGQYWTQPKIYDSVVNGTVTISNTADSPTTYFTRKFTFDNSYNTPGEENADDYFRQENSAKIQVVADDEKSPYVINFVVKSSLKDSNDTYGRTDDYQYVDESTVLSGNQVFNIVGVTLTDRAGNVAYISDSLNNIYLDTEPPVASDVDRPVASIQAKATSDITARTADGRDLYGDDVNITLTLTDPNLGGRITSSGIDTIYYAVIADGTDVIGSRENPEVVHNAEQYKWTMTIPVSSDTNNIEVVLWGFDNSGNESNHVSYKFGIDKTAPIITVTYDNNSAQNEKYFKENRTATVTIQDRNIDFSKIKVTTQVGYSGLSAASANGSGVGNDDTRTFTIPYTTDGDYTLEITGTDAVNHPATVNYEGTAPRDFVLDKTKPIMTVTFNNNDVQNGKYYREGRVATVSIVEHNFSDAGYVETAKNASIQRGTTGFPGQSGFSSNGDNRANTYNFSQDGNYSFTLNYTDLAGNEAETVVVDEFVVDQTPPIVQFDETTVKDNMITNGDIMPTIIFDDTNFSASLINFVLNGAKITDRNSFAVSRALGEFGGTVTYSNFEVTKENDDIYTLTATITDLAGNTGTATVRFSVNRFGSTFEAINGTEDLLQQYYTNTSKSIFIRELNVNDLTEYTVTINRDGTNETLKEGTDFRVTVNTVDGGKEYIYEIFESVFEREGVYTITIQSVDETGNVNSNSTVRRDGGIDDYPITFVVDKTAPSNLINELLSGVRPSKNIFNAASKDIHISFTDNIARAHIIVEVDGVKILDLSGDELRDHLEANNGEIVFNVGAKDNYQHIVITSYDAAGNESEVVEYDVLVSANALVRFYNNKPVFYGSLAGLLALILFILFLLKRKKDDDEEENKA